MILGKHWQEDLSGKTAKDAIDSKASEHAFNAWLGFLQEELVITKISSDFINAP